MLAMRRLLLLGAAGEKPAQMFERKAKRLIAVAGFSFAFALGLAFRVRCLEMYFASVNLSDLLRAFCIV